MNMTRSRRASVNARCHKAFERLSVEGNADRLAETNHASPDP
jgi:hypothetical protein